MTLLLTQAANLLGLSPVTLRKRAAAGMVPGYKPGRSWVFLEEELLAYLKSKKPCRSIAAPTLRTGGFDSSSTDGKSAFHLAQRIAQRRRRLSKSPGSEPGSRPGSASVLPMHGEMPPDAG